MLRNQVYLLGFLTSFYTFALQPALVTLFKLTFPDTSPIHFTPFIFLGLLIGALSAWNTRSLATVKLALGLHFITLICSGIAMHLFASNLIAMCAYTVLLLAPLGHALIVTFDLAKSSRFYFIELVGGLLGLLLNVLFLEFISIEWLFLVLLSVLPVSALFEKSKVTKVLGAGALIFTLSVAINHYSRDSLNLLTYIHRLEFPKNDYNYPYKNGQESLRLGLTEIMHSRWSLSGRIDLLKDVDQKEIAFYGNNSRWSTVAHKDETETWIFPYLKNARTLLDIGAGGGTTLKYALNAQMEVTGVEVSPPVHALMRNELASYSGNLYDKAHVQLREGRRYLEETSKKFDVITIFRRSEIQEEQYSGFVKNYLHTSEGIESILNHTTENGYVIWLLGFSQESKNEEEVSIISTLRKHLNLTSCPKLLDCLIVYAHKPQISHNPRKLDSLLIFKKSPYDQSEVESLQSFMAMNDFHPVLASEQFVGERKWESELRLFSQLVEQDESERYVYYDDLPIQNKEEFHIELLKVGKWYLVSLGLLTLLSFIILAKRSEFSPKLIGVTAASFFTGAYYGLVEMVLLQYFELYFETPVTSFIVVTTCLLIGSSTCALVFKNLALSLQRLTNSILPLSIALTWLISSKNYDLSPVLIGTHLLICGFTLSSAYVGLIDSQSLKLSSFDGWKIYLMNAIGFSFAFFFASWLTIEVGIQASLKFLLYLSPVMVIMGLLWTNRLRVKAN